MKVNFADEYSYVVVQFMQLPYKDIGDLVCIPRSWIRIRRAAERHIIVAYPNEPPSITKMRIMDGDTPSAKWKLYMAIIKVETHSYKDAYEYIMKYNHRNIASIETDYKRVPVTETKPYSPSLKTINLLNPQSKKTRNKLKVVDEIRQSNTISNPRKYPQHSNVESRTLTSSKLTGFVSSEISVIKENCKKEHQDKASRDVRSSSDDLLLRYPYIRPKPKEEKGTQVNSLGAGSQSTRKTLYASKYPLTFLNQVCDHMKKPEENQSLSLYREHLHYIGLTRGIPDNRIPNLRTFDVPESLIEDPNIGSNTSFAIQNFTNENNQLSQLEIPKLSPVIQEHPQVLPNQKIPDHSSEVECVTSELTVHSKMTSAPHALIACTNSAEDQDSILEDMVVDELTEASCIEQNVFSGIRADNVSSANAKALEEANHSKQTIESSMEEGLPMVEVVTLSEISSTQNVDNQSQSQSQNIIYSK